MQLHTNPFTAMAGSLHDLILKVVLACWIRIRVCILHVRTYGNTPYILGHHDFGRIHIRTNGIVA